MPNLREIKKRISNIESIEKTTHSMKAIAASKLTFANNLLESNRSYFDISRNSTSILMKLCAEKKDDVKYFDTNLKGKRAIIFITSDTGLCSSYNSLIFKKVNAEIEKDSNVVLVPIGNKSRSFMKKLPNSIERICFDINSDLKKFNLNLLSFILNNLLDFFVKETIAEISIISSRNITIMEQEISYQKLLPIDMDTLEASVDEDIKFKDNIVTDEKYLSSSCKNIALDYLITVVYRKIVNAAIAEQSTRLNAMDNAHNNSRDMKEKFKLEYNRARQGLITKELVEIISGAESV